MYQAILFDLDGTLLPMDNNEFIRQYLNLLAREMAPHGYDGEHLISTMWKGVVAMVKNDGSCLNCHAFWKVFSSIMGQKAYDDVPLFDDFYNNGFKNAAVFTSPSPLAKKAVEIARNKADKVVLATNPFFPQVAVAERVKWAGLDYHDFDYVTHYSNSCYCKPNPKYYSEIAQKLSIDPSECLMVGNNTKEDVEASALLGFDTFLITDYMIQEGEMPQTKKGSFEDLIDFLNSIE